MNKKSLLIAAFFGAATIMKGGEMGDQPPAPPFVAPIAEKADWSVKIASAQEPPPNTAPSPDVLKEIRVTKVGNLRRAILVATDESTLEFYHSNGYHLSPTSVTGQIMVSQELPTSEPYPFYSKGYYGLDWLRLEFYKGVAEYKNAKCFHYQGDTTHSLTDVAEAGANDKPSPVPAEAWIDCKSRLPIAVRIDGKLLEFVHYPAPPQLVMSAAYDRAWKIQANQLGTIGAMRVVR